MTAEFQQSIFASSRRNRHGIDFDAKEKNEEIERNKRKGKEDAVDKCRSENHVPVPSDCTLRMCPACNDCPLGQEIIDREKAKKRAEVAV